MRKAYFFCLFALGAALASAGDWVKLGAREAKFSTDRDVIMVTAAQGSFAKIKLKVRKNAVHFIDLKVHFGNGEVFDVPLASRIAPGGESRVIDLPGKKRTIKKVVFTYNTAKGPKKRKALVTLWGKH